MRKRIISMLCICMCIFGLAACGTDPKAVDYNGKSYDDLEKNALATWESIRSVDVAQTEMVLDQLDALSDAERTAIMEAQEGMEEQYTLMKSWVNVSREAGDYVGVEDFQVTKTGKTTTTDLILNFDKRSAVLSIVYKNRDMSIETTTVDLVYTTGEKMQKAALNTLMGMGTVFVMLIVICLIISCFAVIPKIEKKLKSRKKQVEPAQQQIPLEPAEQIPVPETDDLELIAVIAAAIAASTGQSTDDFVVRSIKRR